MRDLPQPPPPLPGGGLPGKLIVVESVYHLAGGGAAGEAAAESRFARWLSGAGRAHVDEAPGGVGGDWEAVQAGRVARVGMAVVENLEGTDLVAVPGAAERAAIAARVLEVGFAAGGEPPAPALEVRPGETARFQPAAGRALFLRAAAGGRVRCRVTIIPA